MVVSFLARATNQKDMKKDMKDRAHVHDSVSGPVLIARARSHDLTNVIYRGVAGKEKGGQQPLLLTSISSINVIGKSNFSDRGS